MLLPPRPRPVTEGNGAIGAPLCPAAAMAPPMAWLTARPRFPLKPSVNRRGFPSTSGWPWPWPWLCASAPPPPPGCSRAAATAASDICPVTWPADVCRLAASDAEPVVLGGRDGIPDGATDGRAIVLAADSPESGPLPSAAAVRGLTPAPGPAVELPPVLASRFFTSMAWRSCCRPCSCAICCCTRFCATSWYACSSCCGWPVAVAAAKACSESEGRLPAAGAAAACSPLLAAPAVTSPRTCACAFIRASMRACCGCALAAPSAVPAMLGPGCPLAVSACMPV